MHNSTDKSVSEDEESLLKDEDAPGRSYYGRQAAGTSTWSKAVIALLSLLLCLTLLTHPLFKLQWLLRESEKDKICIAHTSAYPSPVEKDVDIKWNVSPVNGSFEKLTIYRKPASPEVDQAWSDLGAYLKPFIIPEDEAEAYGLHPGQVKRIPEQGGGFVAILESTHHLHCLNVLRQGSHFDYPYYREIGLKTGQGVFADTEELVRLHYSHCLEMLRQRLLCTADTNVCGQVWVKGYGPLVFANVDRKCRNYDEITQWASDHQILPAKDMLVQKRPGDIVYESFP